MSVTEFKKTNSTSKITVIDLTLTPTSKKKCDEPKHRTNNGVRWFATKDNGGATKDNGGEEREAGSVGDCWACGGSLEYTGDGATGIECRDCQMPN